MQLIDMYKPNIDADKLGKIREGAVGFSRKKNKRLYIIICIFANKKLWENFMLIVIFY